MGEAWDQRLAGVAPSGSSSIHKDAWRRWAIHAEYPPSHPPHGLLFQECGATPESENLTLSSSGAIDQSSCTGTPLSSTISSPEGTAWWGKAGEWHRDLRTVTLWGDAKRGGMAPAYPAVDIGWSPRASPLLCHPQTWRWGSRGHQSCLLCHPLDPETGGCEPWGPAAGSFAPITSPWHAASPCSAPHSSSLAPLPLAGAVP